MSLSFVKTEISRVESELTSAYLALETLEKQIVSAESASDLSKIMNPVLPGLQSQRKDVRKLTRNLEKTLVSLRSDLKKAEEADRENKALEQLKRSVANVNRKQQDLLEAISGLENVCRVNQAFKLVWDTPQEYFKVNILASSEAHISRVSPHDM